jgi:polyhydroxybutyrate depolymerase
MTFRKSIFAFIAISIAFNIAQMIYSQDASNEPSRRGFNRTQRSGEPGDLRKMPTTGQRDAIGFFRSMFDTLIEDRVADPEHIYVAGGSNGGVMTMNVVCHLADRIAGAGVLVATLPRAAEITWPKPSGPIPVIIMLGTEDPMKPWSGNRDQMSAEETVAFLRKVNRCPDQAKQWELPDRDPRDGCRVYAKQWTGNAPVVFYTMEGHGHGWPMQRSRGVEGTGATTRDISAPEEFWGFFEKSRSSKIDP